MDDRSDRVLVLVQLKGGNDGLNMVVPLDQYAALSNARSNILIPENKVLPLNEATGLHPAMSGLRNLFQEGKMHIVQGVGYPDQNRSHFRSTDIWTSGSAAGEIISTGWMGRYFDSLAPGYPEGYPNGDFPDPFALTIGNVVSETCQGPIANYSLALENPFDLFPLFEGEGSETDSSYYGIQLAFLQNAIVQTNAYAANITRIAEKGNNLSTLYPAAGSNPLADQLKTVALLLSGGIKTRVFIVSLGGFDTHANQTSSADTATGEHAVLLGQVSAAITAFMDDVQRLGLSERVVGMTFSEFGRRIRSNGGFGTDHGSAAPLLLFGHCTQPGFTGTNPDIPLEPTVQEGVAMQYDFRSVYGSLLSAWFGLENTDIKNLLRFDFQQLTLLQACALPTGVSDQPVVLKNWQIHPNPFRDQLTIQFDSEGKSGFVSLFDALGHEIIRRNIPQQVTGLQTIVLNTAGLAHSNYYIRIQLGAAQGVQPVVKASK